MCILENQCLMPYAEIAKDLLGKIWDEEKNITGKLNHLNFIMLRLIFKTILEELL